MALPIPMISLELPVLPSTNKTASLFASSRRNPAHNRLSHLHRTPVTLTIRAKIKTSKIHAVQESQENTESEREITPEKSPEESKTVDQNTETTTKLGAEIKEAMRQRKEEKERDLWSGVVDEIREIEWPVFGKVLGTTGVVIGVIAGSSVVLLTVNALLAELSDRVFAGKGVQDFFS